MVALMYPFLQPALKGKLALPFVPATNQQIALVMQVRFYFILFYLYIYIKQVDSIEICFECRLAIDITTLFQ